MNIVDHSEKYIAKWESDLFKHLTLCSFLQYCYTFFAYMILKF